MSTAIFLLGFGIGGAFILGMQYAWSKIEEKIEKYEILREQNEARKHIWIDID